MMRAMQSMIPCNLHMASRSLLFIEHLQQSVRVLIKSGGDAKVLGLADRMQKLNLYNHIPTSQQTEDD